MGLKKYITEHKISDQYCFIDGMGNDEYFGHLQSVNQLRSFKLARLGLYHLFANNNYRFFMRSESESQGILSPLSLFFDIKTPYEINEFFEFAASFVRAKLVLINFRAFSRGQYLDYQQMGYKSKLASTALGQDFCLSWKGGNVKNFVFNLSNEYKFDLNTMTNKLLLRKILKEEFDWRQSKRLVDLFEEVPIDIISKMLSQVPKELVKIVIEKYFVFIKVKKRALFELLNLYGFAKNKGYSDSDLIRMLGVSCN